MTGDPGVVRRLARLQAELADENVPLDLDDPAAEVVLTELHYARHPPVHEGRAPRFGAVVVPGVEAMGTAFGALGQRAASIAPLRRPGSTDADVIRRFADGMVRVCTRNGVVVWSGFRWRFTPDTAPLAEAVVHLVLQADGQVLRGLLDRCVHWLSAGRVGGTRHTSARRFSFDEPRAVVAVVSQDGPVTIFSDGAAIAVVRTLATGTELDDAGLGARVGNMVRCEHCRRNIAIDGADTTGPLQNLACPVCARPLEVRGARARARGVRKMLSEDSGRAALTVGPAG